jgi:hypothetical protein
MYTLILVVFFTAAAGTPQSTGIESEEVATFASEAKCKAAAEEATLIKKTETSPQYAFICVRSK